MKLLIDSLLDYYRQQLYNYNSMIKGYGVYLKPLHIVVKNSLSESKKIYYYFGRYWYKLKAINGKLKWIYMGREKPLDSLPDPPTNPLLVLEVKRRQSNPDLLCIYVKNFGKVSAQINQIIKVIYTCCSQLGQHDIKACIELRLRNHDNP
jgi:hypothetical protein